MLLRRYTPSDCAELAELFYNTVHSVNAKDYTEEQLDVWATGRVDLDQWNRSFQEHYTVVALEDNVIAGFGDMDQTGYLDRLYVHKDHQGRGIATAICDELEKTVHGSILTHASITAKPFFAQRGYQVLQEQQVERGGILLTNYVMEKCLINTPALETRRLILRRFTERDLAALYAVYSDIDANRFLPWFPLKSMDEAQTFWKEHYEAAYARPCVCKYAICLKSDNIPVGYINISMDDSHDLGYGLRKEFRHRGIMTEAGRAVLNRVKADGLPYITATHDINNPRSGSVMKQLGMQYQYSYEEQWQPKDILVTFRMYQLNFRMEKDWVCKKYWNSSAVHFIETGI
ncbi:MAG: GNAT family N-acetyltransferase [Acetatifactor sp.]|nr:GNAT family N-acetyltransferase [Acetatifactor sp.]